MTTRRTTRLLVFVVSGLLVVALVALVAWMVLPARQTDDVALPPADASPEEVAVAYMAALDAHDCSTAEDLWVEDSNDGADLWCDDVASLGDRQVKLVRADVGEGDRADHEVVRVGVSFVLDWRWLHDDGSFPEGKASWGYLMTRDDPSGPWRIYDEGNG